MRRSNVRPMLRRASIVLNDLHAIEHGRIPQRVVRKAIYKHTGKLAAWICRQLGVSR